MNDAHPCAVFYLYAVSALPAYGLIGYPLGHSFSPSWFAKMFSSRGIRAQYKSYEITDLHDLPALIRRENLRGLNVTIPYKQLVLSYMDEVDECAMAIGAVNCIDIRDGRLKGYNTDAVGFELSLKPLLASHHTQALVLGSGGASLAVSHVLRKLNIRYCLVSRSASLGQLTYSTLTPDIVRAHPLIINTTPLGMAPRTNELPPLPYDGVGPGHLLFDLIYNPEETKFLGEGRARGAAVRNGLEVLEIQAEESWKIWNR